MQAALLPDRGVVKLAGPDARDLLDRLVTSNIATLPAGDARFAALLTPQGKIVADFILVAATEADGGGFFLDCPRVLAGPLAAKLGFYRLRAQVTIEDLSDKLSVMAIWPDGGASEYGLSYRDPRLPSLGWRIILPPDSVAEAAADLNATLDDASAYHAHRIALGIPQGGQDFIYGDAYPHETNMDQLGGVDFHKGCYVGQEVVSRVEHRATARARIVPITYDSASPQPGLSILAGDKTVGTLGSTANGHGLALLRLDRVEDAAKTGATLEAGGIAITLPKTGMGALPLSRRA